MTDHADAGRVSAASNRPTPRPWGGRLLATLTGAVLGMAVGHGVAWQLTDPLPDDATAREIAASFMADQPGELTRESGDWATGLTGWRNVLFGRADHHDGVISIRFPAEASDPITQYPHVVQVAATLPETGWDDVHLDPAYPIVQATQDGLVARFSQELAEPSAPIDLAVIEPDQEMLGMVVSIRRAAPAGEPLALALGALLGAGSALSLVLVGQRRLRRRQTVRNRVTVLFTVGLAALAPGSLATLGLLYLNVTGDLPHEPLWIAYSLPVIRPLALVGLALLIAAFGATWLRWPEPLAAR